MRLKSIITASLLGVASVASACWFSADNFNASYIAGVNNYVSHYEETQGIANAVYRNGGMVASPITVFVKVSERHPDQSGEQPGPKLIRKAVLQYKVLPNGPWITVRAIQDVSWKMSWNHPVALFGKNVISLRGYPRGTQVLIRLYLSDGTYETGDLGVDITSDIPDTATESSGGRYEGGWSAPHVFRVTYSGKERAR